MRETSKVVHFAPHGSELVACDRFRYKAVKYTRAIQNATCKACLDNTIKK